MCGECRAATMPFFVATSRTLACSHRRRASTGSVSRRQFLREFAELIHLVAIDRLEQCLARREMPIERADADARAFVTASRLASGPPALKTSAAASSSRSRFRTESERGLRARRFRSSSHPRVDLPLAKRRHPPYNSVLGDRSIDTSSSNRRPGAIANADGAARNFSHSRSAAPISTSARLNGLESPHDLSPSASPSMVSDTHVALEDPRVTLLDLLARASRPDRHKEGMRPRPVRRVHRPGQRHAGSIRAWRSPSSLDGAEVATIEGLAEGETLHPVQAAFIAHDGLQCGYCTPGQIMSAIGLIGEGQAGDDPERIREGMSGNICRCGAYQGITEAVIEAQKTFSQNASRRNAA